MTRTEAYQSYLKSPLWKSIRKDAINRDKHKCVKCGSKKRLTVHHVRYPEELGTETVDMLQTLCEDCHNALHGGSPRLGKGKKQIQKVNRRRKQRMKSDKRFAKTIRLSSPVKVFSKEEIEAYQRGNEHPRQTRKENPQSGCD